MGFSHEFSYIMKYLILKCTQYIQHTIQLKLNTVENKGNKDIDQKSLFSYKGINIVYLKDDIEPYHLVCYKEEDHKV